jgi:hypothetical protein
MFETFVDFDKKHHIVKKHGDYSPVNLVLKKRLIQISKPKVALRKASHIPSSTVGDFCFFFRKQYKMN